MPSNARDVNSPWKAPQASVIQHGDKGIAPSSGPVSSSGPSSSAASHDRSEIPKPVRGPTVNVWTSRKPPLKSNASVNQPDDTSSPSRLPSPAQPVQILTRGKDRNRDDDHAVDDVPEPGGAANPPESAAKKKDKKRKPMLKKMSIGDMIPAGTFSPKKGKPQRQSSLPPNPLASGSKASLGATSWASAPHVATRPLNPPSESSAAGLDFAEFPALLSVAPSGAAPTAVGRLPRNPQLASQSELRGAPMGMPPTRASNSSNGTNSGSTAGGAPLRRAKSKQPAATSTALSPSAAEFHLPPKTTRRSGPPAPAGKSGAAAASAAVATLSEPKQRDVSGDEHALLRLMQEGKFVVQNKGRQRIRPRKKKFSALKKKVLQERLRRWRELHPATTDAALRSCDENAAATSSGQTTSLGTCAATTVCLFGFVEPEELEDDDEYEEIVSNLRDMAVKVGPVQRVFVPRTRDVERLAAFVDFQEGNDAAAAVACWNGLPLGGQSLQTALKHVASVSLSEKEWQDWCLNDETMTANDADIPVSVEDFWEVVLVDALTDDDMQDDECFAESVADIKALALQFGAVTGFRVEKDPPCRVYIQYEGGSSAAQMAAEKFGSIVMGGQTVKASVVNRGQPASSGDHGSGCVYVILHNVLSEDDLEDPDCLQESLDDVRELALRYGDVKDVQCDLADSKVVRISYAGDQSVAAIAAQAFNSMTIGGLNVVATTEGDTAEYEAQSPPSENAVASSDENDRKEPPTIQTRPGEKRIPGQFAECLSVPKIPNSGQPRKYATLIENDAVKPLLTEMLRELMRLQKRAMEDKNSKARRRLVMGLREVARGIRAHKVKLVVMANNLDDYGAIDQKLQEILDLSFEEGVPVFFEFSKRALGKAVGKSIKVAVVGVQSAEGAHQQFKKLLALAP